MRVMCVMCVMFVCVCVCVQVMCAREHADAVSLASHQSRKEKDDELSCSVRRYEINADGDEPSPIHSRARPRAGPVSAGPSATSEPACSSTPT